MESESHRRGVGDPRCRIQPRACAGPARTLLARQLRRNVAAALSHAQRDADHLQFFQTVGYYGFSNWVPTLLIKRGIAITNSLEYTFIIAIAAPFGPLAAATIADRLERKWQIVVSAFAVAISGILFGQMTAAGLLIFFGVLLTLANNILSFSSHAYQSELYPTRIRALAVGFVYSLSRISVVFSSFVIGFVLDRFGVPGVFTLIAGSMLIVMLAIGLLGPRTNNLALETISQ